MPYPACSAIWWRGLNHSAAMLRGWQSNRYGEAEMDIAKWGGNGATQDTVQNIVAMAIVVGAILLIYYFKSRKSGKGD